MKQIIQTSAAPAPMSPISQATASSGLIFLSGQLGRGLDGVLVEGGVGAEARQIFKNMKHILEAAQSSLDNVLRVEVYVVDLKDMVAFNEVFKEVFPDNPPARIGVQVAALAAGARMEVTAVAAAPS